MKAGGMGSVVGLVSLLLLRGVAPAQAPDPMPEADAWIETNRDALAGLNRSLWQRPELGLEEHHAVAELTRFLEGAGFAVERGVAGMPTAFVATAGRGRPRIGLLAEYDALPGMSQAAVPRREARPGAPTGGPDDRGHACGHSVFGTASVGAAAAAWHAAHEAGLRGTLRLYGTPAEETGIGKVFMARAGLFDDLDAALHWHPGDRTAASFASSKALVSIRFGFEGLAAHASRSPHEGRSALDGVELMNVGVNYLREHVPEDVRIHYVVTGGGGQPNVVPPRAEVWYYLRADAHRTVEDVLRRVRDVARGAALMTGTRVTDRIESDVFELLPNRPLSELLQRHLERVGPPPFDRAEMAFARETQARFREPPETGLATEIDALPDEPMRLPASTDVGNVSWTVPTGGIRVASYTLAAPGHSWQIVACTGMSIGEKGMIVAARTLAGATLELLADRTVLEAAQKDFEDRRESGGSPASVLAAGQGPPDRIR